MKLSKKYLLSFLVLLLIVTMQSCLIVKEKDEIIYKESNYNYETFSKSSTKISNNILRSKTGDMVVSLPDTWSFIEPKGGISSEVFAIVVNPDYTMSAIFSHIKKTNDAADIVNKEGLIGLSRLCYGKHNEKSNSNITLVDNYKIIDIQQQKFGCYNFVKPKDNTYGRSATFISSTDEYYEFSLVTMNFTNNDLPTQTEFDKIFNSILNTLKY